MTSKAHFHLPGLFEFYDFYKKFLSLYKEHTEFFYEWCDIGSIYGCPPDSLWGGGRIENGEAHIQDKVLALSKEFDFSVRLTFSNSLLTQEHLLDKKCNSLCALFESEKNGIIVHSDLLLDYINKQFPKYYFVSSTTKVITDYSDFTAELNRDEFRYVVPDFRLNKNLKDLSALSLAQKQKIEFLCNECCFIGCTKRKQCYENVSMRALGFDVADWKCESPFGSEGYVFSKAMKNPSFISLNDIQNVYLPQGFSNFKIEGRSLGSAIVLEFLLYYMVKPEYQLNVREKMYLTNTLDLF